MLTAASRQPLARLSNHGTWWGKSLRPAPGALPGNEAGERSEAEGDRVPFVQTLGRDHSLFANATQMQLRHPRIGTTSDVYTHPDGELLKETAELLAAGISRSSQIRNTVRSDVPGRFGSPATRSERRRSNWAGRLSSRPLIQRTRA